MRTRDELEAIDAKLRKMDAEFFGTKETPKKSRFSIAELGEYFKTRELLLGELRDPGWKEAGLEDDVSRALQLARERFISTSDCPSCKRFLTVKRYSETLSLLNQMLGSVGATVNSLKNPMELARGVVWMGRKAAGVLSGKDYMGVEQLICTECKRFFADCPYCSVLNLMGGKISYEGEDMACKNCGRSFAVFIYQL